MGFLLSAGCPIMDASMPDWEMHGKIKADVAYNSEQTEGGSAFMWAVLPTAVAPAVDLGSEFEMTARDSRIIATLGDPESDELTGKVEVDFHNDDVLFRHAFVKMKIADGMTLLAGQTSDLFSPLFPSTLNWYVGWRCGNPGHRSPQLRWEYDIEDAGLLVQVALQDPVHASVGMPDIHARAQFKLGDDPGVTLGASTVIGKTNYDSGANDDTETLSGLAVDVVAKINDMVSIKGEWYVGQNLAQYMGNIGETPNNAAPPAGFGPDHELSSTGLWAQVTIKATDTVTVNAGFMFDSNDDKEIVADQREKNSCIFVNALFKLNDNTTTGIEISRWETEYHDDTAEYDCFRLQGSVIVKF